MKLRQVGLTVGHSPVALGDKTDSLPPPYRFGRYAWFLESLEVKLFGTRVSNCPPLTAMFLIFMHRQ